LPISDSLCFFFSLAYICYFSLLTSLSFFLRLGLLQAGCHLRRLNLGYNLSQFILCCSFSVFDDLYFVDLVVLYLVICEPRLLVLLPFFLRLQFFIFLVLANR